MLSSNKKKMINKQLFSKKLQAKEGAKIKLFMLLLMQGYFLWCITFFGEFFFAIFSIVLHLV